MPKFDKVHPPRSGQEISVSDGHFQVPEEPIIPFIEGDGIGVDITPPTLKVLDAAVGKAYGGKRRVRWFEIYAGEKAHKKYGEWLPRETFDAISHYKIALKGPLTTPVGGGFRSLNVTLRQVLDLYDCVRPVRYFKGVPSPVREPDKMNVVIHRENTEDVYAGYEWQMGSHEAKKLIRLLNDEFGAKIREDSGIGIKPISETGTKRLVRKAIQDAIARKRKSVTIVHKGNIMKYTEGAFRDWGYELARDEFGGVTITENELWESYNGDQPKGKVIVKDRIADSMFQQILTRTDEYDVVAMPNLNGDYFSDACAAQVGGLGMAPGGNIGDEVALFEATHGTAPKYAGQDKVNPGSLILSGALMLEYMGWPEAAKLIEDAMEATIQQKRVTYDLARLIGGVEPVKTSQFAEAIIENLG